jgi:hypothetical protein
MNNIIVPPLLLKGYVASIYDTGTNTSDIPYSNPGDYRTYQWQLVSSISAPQAHGNPNTRMPYAYTCLDVAVGDWVATGKNGVALQIISIDAVTDDFNLSCVVQDVDFFNTSISDINDGSLSSDNTCYIFRLDEEGMPILMGVADYEMPLSFQADLISRFNYRNIKRKYIPVNQPGHDMNVGDAILLNETGIYEKAVANASAARMVGIVTSTNIPTSDFFSFRPIGQVIENISPKLPGKAGGVIYLSNIPGQYTAIMPEQNAKPVFIQMDDAGSKGILLQQGVIVNPMKTKSFEIGQVTLGQTVFVVPSEAVNILEMTINGVELKQGKPSISGVEFTFDINNSTITIYPDVVGYNVEPGDQIIIMYNT